MGNRGVLTPDRRELYAGQSEGQSVGRIGIWFVQCEQYRRAEVELSIEGRHDDIARLRECLLRDAIVTVSSSV